MLLFSLLPEIIQGTILQQRKDREIKHLLFDSRRIIVSENALFFAIKGQRNDGHKYIPELYEIGIRQFIVESKYFKTASAYPEASFFEVENTIVALQKISAWQRNKFPIPVIGITGSNAKTIIKEWLSQLLNNEFHLIKSPRSYNSQIGVPLSVWQINSKHNLGIFEAGISRTGEMEKLEQIIKPSVGVFTNIGSAHNEGFSSLEEKIQEKLILFKSSSNVIYCLDHSLVDQQIKTHLTKCNKFTWSTRNPAADIFIENLRVTERATSLNYTFKGEKNHLSIPFSDEASIENALHCLAVMLFFNIEAPQVAERLASLAKIPMRLELKQGINGCYIIDDTYNNDLAGLSMAIDFLTNQKQKPNKTIILSDIPEAGMSKEMLYKEVASVLFRKDVHRIIGIGEDFTNYSHFFNNIKTFKNTEDFLNQLHLNAFSEEIILVKGARKFKFERIIRALQNKTHGTILEINLDALAHNLNFYRARINPGTKIMAMVKAFAYGSGSFETANLLQFHHIDYLAVAYADEGADLRKNGIHIPIMVMNPSPDTFHTLIQYKLEPEIYNFFILNEFTSFLKRNNLCSEIHIKIDTGMRRLGFEENDLDGLIDALHQNQEIIKVVSVFSHLAAADDSAFEEFTRQQISKFDNITNVLQASLGYPFIKHICNSAGALRYPEGQFDMIRLGIGLYGVEASGQEQQKLKTVATLKTIISQIKYVPKGDTVGYGRKGKSDKEIRIGTIAIGYADGFDRRFSNGNGKVFIKGKLCPVIGNVCMDMTMVDITETDAREGDEVIIFGEKPSITDLSKAAGTIPYEILTGVGERVKRVFFTE